MALSTLIPFTEELAMGGSEETHQDFIPLSTLTEVLEGVIVATKSDEAESTAVRAVLTSVQPSNSLTPSTLSEWTAKIAAEIPSRTSNITRHLANLTLAIIFIRHKSRTDLDIPISQPDLSFAWNLIRSAVAELPGITVRRSSQGFLAIPICSLVREGQIQKLFRIHVWLPDGNRGEHAETAIHSHQPFGKSWVLAGQATDHSYVVKPVEREEDATHAKFAVTWSDMSDGRDRGSGYGAHHKVSTLCNMGELVHAVLDRSTAHSCGMTYSIPPGAFHRSEVRPGDFHATLFLFDASRGFDPEARVLGPIYKERVVGVKEYAGRASGQLLRAVDLVRSFELSIEEAHQYARVAEWEFALRALHKALQLTDDPDYPRADAYRQSVLYELGHTHRKFGRYEQAQSFLRLAVDEGYKQAGGQPSLEQVKALGELGVVYRHMDDFESAQRIFQTQYDLAKVLKSELETCRAVGNLGMVTFQLSQVRDDAALLQPAIEQLRERVSRARDIRNVAEWELTLTPTSQDSGLRVRWAIERELIGLSRLSLCYASEGEMKQAVIAAAECKALSDQVEDPSVRAMSKFFYGRALFLDGQREEAVAIFNEPGALTPAIAFCQEPSEEHRQYLRKLVDAGADVELTDDRGYTPLDYAIYNGDQKAEQLVLEGLRRKYEGSKLVDECIAEHLREARVRKGYRLLFQEKMRPALSRADASLRSVRRVYHESLIEDKQLRESFDFLRLIPYRTFLDVKALPRFTSGMMVRYGECEEPDAVVFFSYRWVSRVPPEESPDDANHSQYQRMVKALEDFLLLHPSVNLERLYIWVVSISDDHGKAKSTDFAGYRTSLASIKPM